MTCKSNNAKPHTADMDAITDPNKLLNSTAVKTPEMNRATPTEVKENKKNESGIYGEERKVIEKPQTKGFILESLMRSGSKKIQLAQMTEDSEGFTLKKIRAASFEHSSNSPRSKDSSIFNFSKSKSLSASSQHRDSGDEDTISEGDGEDEDKGEPEEESVYNFPKPKSSPGFTSSFTNSISSNMSKMGFNMRGKDGEASYNRGQPSSHLLLSNEVTTAPT